MDNLSVYISGAASIATTLGAVVCGVRWLAKRLEYVNQIPELTDKVGELDKKVVKLETDVKEAIDLKKLVEGISIRLLALEAEKPR